MTSSDSLAAGTPDASHLMPGNEDEAVALVGAYLERATKARRIAQLDQ